VEALVLLDGRLLDTADGGLPTFPLPTSVEMLYALGADADNAALLPVGEQVDVYVRLLEALPGVHAMLIGMAMRAARRLPDVAARQSAFRRIEGVEPLL
jgi:hypothetical protein